MSDADRIIETLDLSPHPEGGFYRETYRDRPAGSGRGSSTHIYYLLREGEVSRWHRIDAVEMWHWYAGAPLALHVSTDGESSETLSLGNDLTAGERPCAVVPAHQWQSAHSLGTWSLVGCTVAPAFEFEGFEFAPDGWAPKDGKPS